MSRRNVETPSMFKFASAVNSDKSTLVDVYYELKMWQARHEDCRLVLESVPSPLKLQTLVHRRKPTLANSQASRSMVAG